MIGKSIIKADDDSQDISIGQLSQKNSNTQKEFQNTAMLTGYNPFLSKEQ